MKKALPENLRGRCSCFAPHFSGAAVQVVWVLVSLVGAVCSAVIVWPSGRWKDTEKPQPRAAAMAARSDTLQLSRPSFWAIFGPLVFRRRASSLAESPCSRRTCRSSFETCILYHLFPGGLLIVYRQAANLCTV
uniref:Uncharacterized protein n=1 Tax=Siphoviridae sp. ctBeL15 TaxID=2825374 RepID=A0A8S5V0H5_9CAUD|nr:MAG TPA: hypothetical protein [Siphoviridae sp. ctBeL15]